MQCCAKKMMNSVSQTIESVQSSTESGACKGLRHRSSLIVDVTESRSCQCVKRQINKFHCLLQPSKGFEIPQDSLMDFLKPLTFVTFANQYVLG